MDCALTGRGLDGALFRITHGTSDTLSAMQPQVMSLECDLGGLPDGGGDDGDSSRRRLLQLDDYGRHASSSGGWHYDGGSLSVPEFEGDGGANGNLVFPVLGRRGLLQFLGFSYSNPTEVKDFFSRGVPSLGGEETADQSDFSLTGQDGGPSLGDWVKDNKDDKDNNNNSGSNGDEASKPRQKQQRPAGNDVPNDIARCVDDVTKLASNVQWWSRGAGPLEPGLPNEPYQEYVFAGSLDALAGGGGGVGASSDPDVDLRGVVLPVVFSPWVLDKSQVMFAQNSKP